MHNALQNYAPWIKYNDYATRSWAQRGCVPSRKFQAPSNQNLREEQENYNFLKYITVFALVSRPGWLSREVCKMVGVVYTKGWLMAILNIPLFLRGGGLSEILSKDKGVAYTRGRLTRASTVYRLFVSCNVSCHASCGVTCHVTCHVSWYFTCHCMGHVVSCVMSCSMWCDMSCEM